MSFSEIEAPLLESYLNDMASQGYEITKIARYYLRFRKTDDKDATYYVRSYRKHYAGHLYWQFSKTPLAPSKSYGSRFYYHLMILLLLALCFILSLTYLHYFDYKLLYSDGKLALALTIPFFTFSFFLDFLGRFVDSCRYHKNGKQVLKFAHYRAIFLGTNMFLRYFVLMMIVVPLFLKELHLTVVFFILSVVVYEVATYYLPDRYRRYLIVASAIFSLVVCGMLGIMQQQQPFHKDEVDYDNLTLMRLSYLIDIDNFDESQNYVRQVHRYTSMSLFVPFNYERTETMSLLNEKEVLYQSQCAYTICRNEKVAKYIYQGVLQEYTNITPYTKIEADEAYSLDGQAILARIGENIYYFQGNFDIESERVAQTFENFVRQNTKDIL